MVALFGVEIPLWLFMIIGVIGVLIAWKMIKFALTLLFILIIVFIALMLLDVLGVFQIAQNILSSI